uniref:Glutamine amidotransferase type-2 domain-containing protein n=1 Tax=Populus trichocarpa TaxID=3694 RepID=A0A2K1YUP4_POPTR|eukprot:XP_024465417.1 asparagine synthetase domain-containing protein 1 isoform X2 [Populus trichocarpa]
MCGIALIVSGIRIDLSSSTLLQSLNPEPLVTVSVDDLKAALRRRGPDSLGSKKIILQYNKNLSSVDDRELVSVVTDDAEIENDQSFLQNCSNGKAGNYNQLGYSVGELQFIGATLQLRGLNPIIQPFVDSYGNVLIYNGEIFGGIHVESDRNDGEVLMQTLGNCCSCGSNGHTGPCSAAGHGCSSVPNVFSTIKGPWAIIYWQESSRTLWFGRDAFGRRSLVVHWPTVKDSRFLISSVSPFSSVDQSSDFEVENGTHHNFWEELSCGIYSLSMDASKLDGYLVGEVKNHEWGNAMLLELIKWERVSFNPKPNELHGSLNGTLEGQHHMYPASSDIMTFESGPNQTMISLPAHNVLSALRKSVMLRASQHRIFEAGRCYSRREEHVPVAVLFSGGLDSMILSALLDECLDPSYGIDLLNVSFDGQSAPDRISAKAGVKELRRIAPLRRWKLVEIDSDLSKLTLEMKHVMSLINPANTYMDLNIGVALWLAASGDGWVSERPSTNSDENQQRLSYKSEARIVLVGSGADEQCAGYGRHRTKYRCGGWHGLNEEMKLDMQRIWKRNMGRDDRCIADNGKEARFPFLDEDVIRVLLDIPLWEVTNLDQPSGTGDKKILREVAQMLGLHEAAVLPKRAIQFGSRIARESNRKNFGSNRAANQASAGSVMINRS